ncbi:hypothetical protein IKG13_00745 [Candidatus Saccharibacteria bacterium]|nr:hypothetical protein [Candidatus Saccharibacteria bacterium]MBR3377914.1 hypothetical protein [Candidatus Saccharibacteria bacterium]
MKRIWTKVGAVALAGVVVCNAFIPFATATDTNPSLINNATLDTENIAEIEEYFSVENNSVDFGRVTELDRSYTKEIEIKNNTQNDVVIDASVQKVEGVSEDYQELGEWIAFVGGVTHFGISAGQSRSLGVRAFVPVDAKAGSQYANVVLDDGNGHKETVSVKIDIVGDDLKYSSEVVDAWIDPVRIDKKLNGRVSVKNNGTAGFTSAYQIKVKNFFGGDDWRVLKEEKSEVYPGGKVDFSETDELGFGVFSIEQRVTFVNSEGRMIESLLSRTVINLPWWSLAIAGGVIVLIILIIILAKRRHKNKKKDADKMKKADKKARKAAIEKIEKAEEDAMAADDEEAEPDEEAEEVVESEEAKPEKNEEDEIEAIADQLEESEAEAEDDDADYDEEEAIPIKVTIKKSSKKSE